MPDPDILPDTAVKPAGQRPAGLADLPPAVPGYELVEEVGRGGMGVVYRARDLALGRDVAVKLILPGPGASAAAARFVTESTITARLPHPHVPPVHALGTAPDGLPFLAMKLVKGRTLHALLADRPGPGHDLARWVGAFEAVCQGVGFAHSQGVIHRDLKPGNVMVGSFGEVQVMDWGLAKDLSGWDGGSAAPDEAAAVVGAAPDATTARPDPDTDHRTRAGRGMGTPAYMPPEQAHGRWAEVDARADVFALGSILCVVLTGKPAYAGATAAEVVRRARAGDLADAHARLDACGADGELVALARRCLSPDPAGRPADGGEVARLVAAYQAGVAARLQRAVMDRQAAEVRAGEDRKRRRLGLRAAAAVVAVSAAGAGVSVWQAVRATAAEGRTADQLEQTRRARADAEAAAADARAAEGEKERQRAEAMAQRDAAAAAKEFLQAVLVQGDPRLATKDRAAEPNRLLRDALDAAARDIEGRFADQPGIAADLRDTIGQAYQSLGAYRAAEGHLRAALGLREGALGAGHPDTLASASGLALLYQDTGDYRRAEPLLVRALEGREGALGKDHPSTLASVHNLALLYRETGDPGRAEPLAARALAGREGVLGRGHPDTLASASSLALLYRDAGDHRRAEPLLVRAVGGYEKALGPDHPSTLAAVNHLAGLYRDAGDHGRAEPLFARAVGGYERALGADHPSTLAAVNNLAGLYREVGDYGRAEPLFVRAVQGYGKALGADHPDTLTCVGNLAGLYWATGRLDRSVPLFEDTLGRQRAALGDGHPDALLTRANLGVNLRDADRPAEAVPHLERAYAARKEHPAAVGWVGPELADAYAGAGRPADAARVVREVLAEERSAVKPGSPELGGLLTTAGGRLLALDPAAAEPVLRECLELGEKPGPAAWHSATARSMLGEALLLRGKPAEAEPLLVAGYAGLLADAQNIPPPGRGDLPDAASRLARVYLALGKPDEAAKWRAERQKYPPDTAPRPRVVVRVAPPPREAKQP